MQIFLVRLVFLSHETAELFLRQQTITFNIDSALILFLKKIRTSIYLHRRIFISIAKNAKKQDKKANAYGLSANINYPNN